MKIFVVFVLLLYACGCSVLQKSNAFTIDPASFLLTLDPGHPRMMMKDKDLGNLKKQYETDEALKKYAADVLAEADKDMGKPMLQYKDNHHGLHHRHSIPFLFYLLVLLFLV